MPAKRKITPGDPLFLGVECGGTHTVALLANDRAETVQRFEAGPANPRLLSDRQLGAHFRKLASSLPKPAALGIGMPGVQDEKERSRIRLAAAQAWPDIPCWIGSDLQTALAAAGSSSTNVCRVIIISGTGSCCYGRNPAGATVKAGGWGHVIGDRGSAYDISRRALRMIMEQFDQSGQWPALGAQLLQSLLLNSPNDLVTWAQNASKAGLAALAKEVFQAAQRGDPIARQVTRQAAETLAKDAAACAAQLVRRRAPVEFLLSGSVLLKQPAFAAALKRRLSLLWPKSVIKPLQREGVWGAVVYAEEEWLKNKTSTLEKQSTPSISIPHPDKYPLPVPTALSPTEQRHPKSMHLDRLSVASAIELVLREDAAIPAALLRERKKIERAVRLITQALGHGGRLFYVGAGSSGRLGVLDASECPPTFRTPPELVQGIMAGGPSALWSSVEGAEDDAEAGAQAMMCRGVARRDIVVGIAASGRTPFVWGALHAAKALHAKTILISFNPHLNIRRAAAPTLVIAPEVGPEILTGSTRLKAGTATKLLLNIFTTLSMVQLGKVVENLMVDLNPSNAKLRDRAIRIVMELTGAERTEAQRALAHHSWVVKQAVAELGR